MAKNPPRIVIDACIARAAGGETATFPTSKYCRDFLSTVLTSRCCVVMTSDIRDEWDKHQSRFARYWRVQMSARKKFKKPDSDDVHDQMLRDVKRTVETVNDQLMFKRDRAALEKDQSAIEKDWCLVIAALNSERLITSLDEIMRRLLSAASADVAELYDIVWVNPGKIEEDPIAWLESGAPPDRRRYLGLWSLD